MPLEMMLITDNAKKLPKCDDKYLTAVNKS